MPGKYHSLFLRKKFTLQDDQWIKSLVIRVDYRDGFVAYLNGTEIARRGLAGELGQPVPFNALASAHYRGNPELIDLEPYKQLLVKGENILAVQAHDDSINSNGFAFHVELLANIVRGPIIESTTTTDTKIAWQTLKPTTSVVEYGLTTSLGKRIESEMLTTDHVLQLIDLEPKHNLPLPGRGYCWGNPAFLENHFVQDSKTQWPRPVDVAWRLWQWKPSSTQVRQGHPR